MEGIRILKDGVGGQGLRKRVSQISWCSRVAEARNKAVFEIPPPWYAAEISSEVNDSPAGKMFSSLFRELARGREENCTSEVNSSCSLFFMSPTRRIGHSSVLSDSYAALRSANE